MDGFTGLNIEGAHVQIENFYDTAYDVMAEIMDLEDMFLHDLRSKWASPNAVEFSVMTQNKISELYSTFVTYVNHIVHGANDAGRTLAVANGASWSDVNLMDRFGNDGIAGEPCLETLNGTTGMAVENVKIISDAFVTGMKNVLNTLNSVPTSISFYDANGDLLSSYSTGINKFSSQIENLTNSIVNTLKQYIETETNNILLAKEQATNKLNG